MSDKAVGILGGMGPSATVDLMARIIRATPALDDCDHVRLIVDSNPQVPSRIRALIEGTGESPLPCLVEMARKLEAWGADFLAMPCNTAHHYHAAIQAAVSVPLLNMVQLTVQRVLEDRPEIKRVGLLASPAVKRIGLFEDRFSTAGVTLLYPGNDLQDALLECIRQIKAGTHGTAAVRTMERAARHLVTRGAGVLVVACTELSIVAEGLSAIAEWYDSAQVLAESIVRVARQGR